MARSVFVRKGQPLRIHLDPDNSHIISGAVGNLSCAIGTGGGTVSFNPARSDVLVVDPSHPRAFDEFLRNRPTERRPPVVLAFWVPLCMITDELIWLDHPHWNYVSIPLNPSTVPIGLIAYSAFFAGRNSVNTVAPPELAVRAPDLLAKAVEGAIEACRMTLPGPTWESSLATRLANEPSTDTVVEPDIAPADTLTISKPTKLSAARLSLSSPDFGAQARRASSGLKLSSIGTHPVLVRNNKPEASTSSTEPQSSLLPSKQLPSIIGPSPGRDNFLPCTPTNVSARQQNEKASVDAKAPRMVPNGPDHSQSIADVVRPAPPDASVSLASSSFGTKRKNVNFRHLMFPSSSSARQPRVIPRPKPLSMAAGSTVASIPTLAVPLAPPLPRALDPTHKHTSSTNINHITKPSPALALAVAPATAMSSPLSSPPIERPPLVPVTPLELAGSKKWTAEEDKFVIEYMNWWFRQDVSASTDEIIENIALQIPRHDQKAWKARFRSYEDSVYMQGVPELKRRLLNKVSGPPTHEDEARNRRNKDISYTEPIEDGDDYGRRKRRVSDQLGRRSEKKRRYSSESYC